jgi:hypothetical protein
MDVYQNDALDQAARLSGVVSSQAAASQSGVGGVRDRRLAAEAVIATWR